MYAAGTVSKSCKKTFLFRPSCDPHPGSSSEHQILTLRWTYAEEAQWT